MAVTITSDGVLSAGGAVVETSGGVKYAIFRDKSTTSNIHIYKDIDGAPSSVYNDNLNTLSIKDGIDAAIDSNDYIHIVIANDNANSNSIYYAVLDTSDDTWNNSGELITLYDEGIPDNPGVAISIDSSDYPHVLFVDSVKQTGSVQDNVYYTERTGGSWAAVDQIGARGTKTDSYNSPKITLRNNDDVEAWYYFVTDGDPAHNTYTSAAWQGENVYTETSATVGDVIVASAVERYYVDASDNIIEGGEGDTTYNTHATINEISVVNVPIVPLPYHAQYVFYIDTDDDVHYIYDEGSGWTDGGDLQTGTYTEVIAEWAYNNENQSNEINYLFADATNVYYDSLTFGSASASASASESASASASESVSASASASASASSSPSASLSPSASASASESASASASASASESASASASASASESASLSPSASASASESASASASASASESASLSPSASASASASASESASESASGSASLSPSASASASASASESAS